MNANCLKGISLLIVLLFAVQQVSFCQRTDKLVLKFVPLALIDPHGSNIQFGAEAFTGKKWSLEADFAVYSPALKQDETPRISGRKGFKIKPEIRYYRKARDVNGKPSYGFYISGEVFYVKDHFKRGDTFIRNPGSGHPRHPQDLLLNGLQAWG